MEEKMKKSNPWIWMLLVIFCLFTLSGRSAWAEDVITIGYSGPLSGGGAQFGQNLKMGLELAADEINALGGATVSGKKFKVRIVSMDDQFQTALTVNNAKRLVHQEGARMVFNPSSGGIFGLMAINESENFIVGAYTTNQKCVTAGNKLLFRGPTPMMSYVRAWADHAMAKGWKRCAMMPDAYDYGKLWGGLFQKYWQEKGGTITTNIPVDFMKVTDFYPLLTNALATKPDCILIGSSSEPDAMQIQQARELGFKGGFIIIERGKLEEMEKIVSKMEVLNGCIGTAPFMLYPGDNVKKLAEKVFKKYGRDKIVTHETGIAYANVLYYVAANSVAGTTTDTQKIMKALLSPAIFKVPFLKDNDPYYTDYIYPNGAVKGKIWGVEMENGRYGKPFEVKSPDWTYTTAY
jgi:branched-chain amino acid transport system substrate-binding protein